MALRQRRGTSGNKAKRPPYRLCTLFNALVLLCVVTIFIWTFIVKTHQNAIISSNASFNHQTTNILSNNSSNDLSHDVPDVSNTPSKLSNSIQIDENANLKLWLSKVKDKTKCISHGYGDIFMYHMRKAAGTTLREVLTIQSKRNNVLLLELEGLTLPPQYILNDNDNNNDNDLKGLLTAVSLRHPIERIQSLYWYEHVAWWIEVRHLKQECKTFDQWVFHWSDSNDHKKGFSQINPYNNYVEISNYYVKSLIGWKNTYEKITEKELKKAKQVLNHYDLILISDWLRNSSGGNISQELMWDDLLPGSKSALKQQLVKVNPQLKLRNKNELMPVASLPTVLGSLYQMNEFDLKLWEYALELVASRYHYWKVSHEKKKKEKQKNLRGDENPVNGNFCLGSTSSDSSGSSSGIRGRRRGKGCYSKRFKELKRKWTGLYQPRGHKE